MISRCSRHVRSPSLVISIIALVFSTTGLASAARQAVAHAVARIDGHRVSTTPYAGGLLLLGSNRKFSASSIPTVSLAKQAQNVGGLTTRQLLGVCPSGTADIGSWCLDIAPRAVSSQDNGQNDYFFASRACAEAGGYLPSATQLIGAANRVKLESTIHDSPLTASVEQNPGAGLKDQREMSSTLVTTAAGSEAAGTEGVSVGATGNPNTGEPNPVPAAAVPAPNTLQYVTVYSDGTTGGFAGSEPVLQAENFRCAFTKTPAAKP